MTAIILALSASLFVTTNSFAADFQDGHIAERIKAALSPQVGPHNVGTIAVVLDHGKQTVIALGQPKRI